MKTPLLPDAQVGQSWEDVLSTGVLRNPLREGSKPKPKGRKYSEDQERDELGRFGSGGAGSESADNARAPGDIAVSAHFSTISEKAQIATVAWMEKNGVTMERMQDQIRGRLEHLEEGKAWYPDARARMDEVAARTGIPVERIAAATSALSPRTPWELENGEGNRAYGEHLAQFIADGKDTWPDGTRMSAEDTVLAWKMAYSDENQNTTIDKDTKEERGLYPASYNDNAADAVDVLRGDKTPDEALTDNKTRSFYDDFMNPESSEVTIDTHMFKLMEQEFGWTKAETEKAFHQGSVKADQAVSSFGYTALAQAIRNVADELGITPSAVQAAVWLDVQPMKHIT